MKLNNQEIRNCIYQGVFNNFLKECNKNFEWIKINRIKPNTPNRFRTIELILRFFAFHFDLENYSGKLAIFLNDFMEKNKNISESDKHGYQRLFEDTVQILDKNIMKKIKQRMGITLLETVLYGISQNINHLRGQEAAQIYSYYDKLKNTKEMSEFNLSEGLADKTKVINRLQVAAKIFSGHAN